MNPITFSCKKALPFAAEDIAQQILDLSRWPEFRGYGPIPGIKAAEFDIQTPSIVGSRILVTNRDGSNHVEEIIEWQPNERICIRMTEFSRPLSRLATHFEETWEFKPGDGGIGVLRSFRLYPKSLLAWVPLLLISFLLKRAIQRHLREMWEAA
jgi:hypothetical protein